MSWRLSVLAVFLISASTIEAQSPQPAQPNLPFQMLKPTLDVGFVIADPAKSEEFYGGLLGMKKLPPIDLPDGGKMHRFQYGSSTIKLLQYEKTPPAYQGGINNAVGLRLLTLFIPDLDKIVENAAAHGFPKPGILGKGRGQRLIFINDPDGNQVELLELPEGAEPAAADRTTVGLTVTSIEKSREFYGKILGLPEQPSRPLFNTGGPIKYIFEAGKSTIKFWSFEKELPVHTGKWDEAVGIRYMTFLVKDVDAAFEELTKRGAKIAQPPTDFGSLARVMFITDPDGNYIELAALAKPKAK
ncbi:VOC family protein [Candidatus Sumerlaeota bacterium]|nr:VOC family protein [Candidatus Sumerlaeota bacterium]